MVLKYKLTSIGDRKILEDPVCIFDCYMYCQADYQATVILQRIFVYP